MDAQEDREVMKRASDAGYTLRQRETDVGQSVWSWLPPHQGSLGPEFLTRREAIGFMRQRSDPPPRAT